MDTECLVLGSGLAGLVLALKVADQAKVLLCTKTDLATTNSAMAQGGIAAVMAKDDSFAQHEADTLVAGAGLCNDAAVRFVVEHGRSAIDWLVAQGVPFTRDDQNAAEHAGTNAEQNAQRRRAPQKAMLRSEQGGEHIAHDGDSRLPLRTRGSRNEAPKLGTTGGLMTEAIERSAT